MRIYNPPKNWPAPPPGWQPYEGWKPDPTWGPAPTGHQFWIEIPDTRPGNDQRGKTLTTTAMVLAAVALVLCWIPLLNVVALLLGLSAAVLGTIALVNGSRTESSLRNMAIAALAIGSVALLGSIVTLSAYSFGNAGSTSASAARDMSSPTASASPSLSASQPPLPTPKASAGSAAEPHPIGTVALLGNQYRAAVTGIKLNANEDVLANYRFNDAPEGQYVLVDIAVTYVGVKEGNPWLDLSPTFVGSDARQYDSSDCGASLTNGEMKVPTLEKGGSATYQVCMDVPPGAIEGGKIFIENDWSFRDQRRTYWGLK